MLAQLVREETAEVSGEIGRLSLKQVKEDIADLICLFVGERLDAGENINRILLLGQTARLLTGGVF